MNPAVQGQCPMGCGATLFLGSGGYVRCSWVECPKPSAAAEILIDGAYPWHVVVLSESDYRIQHPIRERLNGELFDCGLDSLLHGLSGPPRKPGRYRVHGADGAYSWQEVASS